ncbi:MAG TPA: SPOR domain-containing protein [Telluria sp.]
MGFSSQSEQDRQEPAGEDSGHFFKADDADAIAAVAKSKRASSAGEGAPRRARKSAAADPMLPEKKRARRRLVGAIALALAVAVGLPMILDSSEPKQLANDIAVQIPSMDKAPPLPVPAAAAPADAGAQSASPDVATVDATAALGENEEVVDAPAAASPPPPAEEPKPQPKPEVKAPPKPEPVAAAPAREAAKPAAKPADDASRALAILEGKPVAAKPKAAAAPGGEKFVVQVGAFSSAEKVAELRSRLSAEGIASYTQKAAKDVTRVRVGPFATRAQADQVQAKLRKIGLSGTVVAD